MGQAAGIAVVANLDRWRRVKRARQRHAVELNVRQGQAPDDLYAGRLETVMRHLRQAGVAADRMKVGDELAGGDGMTSSEVVLILAISQEETGLWESDSGFDE